MAPIQAQDINNNTISLDDSSVELFVGFEETQAESFSTYTNLNDKIYNADSGSTIDLTENYAYDDNHDSELKEGIQISKNLTIVGKSNSYIDGSGSARGFYIGSNCNVVLENITIKNCYSQRIDPNYNGNGGGIFLDENSTLTLRNCLLIGNKVANEWDYGGAIYAAKGAQIEISDSVLDCNNVGSGLYAVSGCNAILDNVNITNSNGQGNVYFGSDSNVTIINSFLAAYESGYMDALINFQGSNIEIRNSVLDCKSVARGLSSYSSCNAILDNVAINNCPNYNEGIYLGSGSNLTLRSCALSDLGSNCYSLISFSGLNIEIHDTTFDCRGAALNIYSANALLDNINVLSSNSDSSLIYFSGSNMTMLNSVVDGSGSARGLYVGSCSNVILEKTTIKNCYSRNKNNNGGGIFLCSGSNLTLQNCNLINNKVYNANGGAIGADSWTHLYIFNTTVSKSTGQRVSSQSWNSFKAGMGSAIYVNKGSVVELAGSTFKDNDGYLSTIVVVSHNDGDDKPTQSNLRIDHCTFENNKAQTNGVIYLDEYGACQILNSVFKNNSATKDGGIVILDSSKSALVKNCRFEKNSAKFGGGIEIYVYNENDYSNASIVGCTFYKNTVSGTGGAIYAKYGKVNVSGSTFDGNKANGGYGGAIFITNKTVLTIDGSTFKNNQANYGGAIYTKTTLNVIGSTFTSNKASKNGGAIYSNQGTKNIENCIFDSNTAPYGGAIYSSDSVLNINGSTFKSNVADYGGGFYTTDKLKLTNTKFIDNKGTKNGGAIYSKSESVVSSGCTYSGNTAKYVNDACGAFTTTLTPSTFYWGDKLTIQFKSLWGVAFPQKVKVDLSGASSFTTNWVKTSSKGYLSFVPTLKVGKHTLTCSFLTGTCNSKTIKVLQSPCKITVSKMSAKYKAKKYFKVTVKNSKTKRAVIGAKIKLTIFTGKKSKTYTVTTNKNGVAQFKTSSLSRGKHTVKITAGNSYIKFSKVSSSITIK